MTCAPESPRRWPLLVVFVLALGLRLPALAWDFFVDDHGLMYVLDHDLEHPTLRPWNLFDFGGVPAAASETSAPSGLPWWTSPDWKARFFRPLPSLTHWLDRSLFGDFALGHHLTSLIWFALLFFLLHALYRAAGLSPSLALWAVTVFACDDGSLMPVAWLANRNSLIETTFAVGAALIALRGGPRPSTKCVVGALTCALCACLSKESGVAVPLLIAALLRTRSGRAARAGSVAGVLLALAFVAFLLGAGYGTRSDFYLTPWGAPLHFARRAGEMIALGSLSAFGPFAVDFPMFFDALYAPWLLAAVVIGGTLAALTWRAAGELPLRGFFGSWALLTILPQAGAFPSDRLLFLPMVGIAPLVAALASRALGPGPRRQRWLPALVALSVVPLSALMLGLRGLAFVGLIDAINAAAVSLEVPRDGRQHDALVFQTGSMLNMLSPGPVWALRTGRTDISIHPLQVSQNALCVTAVDERTLDIESLDGALLTRPFERVFLSGADQLAPGVVRRQRGFEVEIREASADGPTLVRLRLGEPIASPRWCFLTWKNGAFRAFVPPPPGASLELERATPLDPMLP